MKTHRLTVFLALPNETTISAVKEQVLSAFTDDVFKGIQDVPNVSALDDFVLSREVVERGQGTSSHDILTDNQKLKDVVGNWAVLFVQFKDDSGARNDSLHQFIRPSSICPGNIRPIEVTIPSLADDDEDYGTLHVGSDPVMDIDEAFEQSGVGKGKRRAVN